MTARLVKAREVAGRARVVPAPVLDARVEAERQSMEARRLRQEAEREADALRVAARAEADVIRATAREEGFAEGRQEGLAEATEILLAARRQADEVRLSVRDAAAALAVAMTRRLVGHAFSAEPALVAEVAAAALAEARTRAGRVTLRVHPDDAEMLEQHRAALMARIAAGAELTLTPDPSVPRGGCIVETAVGRVDARLESQIEALGRVLSSADPR